MKAINTTTDTTDRKSRLSLLWIFVMFNFTYGDILTLYFNNVLQKKDWTLFQSGTVGSVHITQVFVLLGAVLLETAIVMVLLSRILPYRANRWANIIVGIIQIVANVQALTGPIVRGDAGTVHKHIEALEEVDPELAELYRLLGRRTTRLAAERGLDADTLAKIRDTLEGRHENEHP